MNTKSTLKSMRGFTLVELMVVVFLTAIAVISIYRGYTSFSHSADVQEQVIEMQQNLRIGMHWLEKDIRRAGINEEDDDTAGFLAAEEDAITFTMDLWGDDRKKGEDLDTLDALDGTNDDIIEDLTGDGDTPLPNDYGERIHYELNSGRLQRQVWECDATGSCGFGTLQTIITNVDALNFVFLSEDLTSDDEDDDPDDLYLDDLDKAIPTVPVTGRDPLIASEMSLIRSVRVCLVVRTTNEDYRYTNNERYRNMQDSVSDDGGEKDVIFLAPGDNYRRRILCKEIKIRNAGL